MKRSTVRTRGVICGVVLLEMLAGSACADHSGSATKVVENQSSVRQVSTLQYTNQTVEAIVKMSGRISANGSAFFVDPSLEVGQVPGANSGVSAAEAVGAKGKHCYSVEARRLKPVKAPRKGSRTKFGFARVAKGTSGRLTQVLDGRFASRYAADWKSSAAKKMGCGGA